MKARQLVHLARRAANAPAREWRDRSRQKLFETHNRIASWGGRSALRSDGALRSLGLGSDAELARWWMGRSGRWFIDDVRLATLGALTEDVASGVPGLLAGAREVCAGRFPLFSCGPVPIGEQGEWRRDPILGRTAPQRFYADIHYLDPDEVGDSKFVWESSRFASAVWLGVAYALEPDPACWRRFAGLVTGWLDQNPYPIGVHYCSALEMGLRAYAWVWSLALFREALEQDPAVLRRLLEGVWTACRHIEANLSWHFSPNTHLTGEAFSLFACGAALPEFAEAERWRRLGSDVLREEALRQFHRDGTHRELSSCYHLYSCDFYLQAALIAHETGFPVDPEVPRTARRLCIRLAELAPASGILPQWNDCDGGKLLSLAEDPLDARPTLSAAHAAFGEPFAGPLAKSQAGPHSPDASTPRAPTPAVEACGYALLMAPAVPLEVGAGQPVPGASSSGPDHALLPDSGIAVHRNFAGDYLVFRASPFGYRDCPHSHDAPLSLILHLAGCPLIVDSGTGSYTRDPTLRDALRGATGKSVLLFDGEGPSRPSGPFSWTTTTEARLHFARREEEGCFRCAGSYDAPRRAAHEDGLHVEREVALIEAGRRVEIVDRWRGNPGASVEARFTLAPDAAIDPATGRLTLPELGELLASCESPAGQVDPTPRIEAVPYSQNYGSVGETSALVFALGRAVSGSCTTRFSLTTRSAPTSAG